jgi:hypothetical protein
VTWRQQVAPVQLVIGFIGIVLFTALVGIITLAVLQRSVPDELGTVCIASMTALAGVLAPNTGALSHGPAARRAEAAGQAAAAAVIEADRVEDQAAEDEAVQLGNAHRDGRGPT